MLIPKCLGTLGHGSARHRIRNMVRAFFIRSSEQDRTEWCNGNVYGGWLILARAFFICLGEKHRARRTYGAHRVHIQPSVGALHAPRECVSMSRSLFVEWLAGYSFTLRVSHGAIDTRIVAVLSRLILEPHKHTHIGFKCAYIGIVWRSASARQHAHDADKHLKQTVYPSKRI